MGTSHDPVSLTPRLAFRPDIEGLRAVAVALVVLLHAGVTSVTGGYIGVDVFFVISGFLITSLMMEEARSTGKVSLTGFYARRARRILPAACFVIAATVAATYLQLGPLLGRSTAVDGLWASGFVANARFIHLGTDYFAKNLPPSPLQHYWSLAVEEQFYLLWPSIIAGCLLLGRSLRKPVSVVRLGIVLVIAGSFSWSVHQSVASPTTAYFSPFTRAWELGAGALVAVSAASIARIPPRIARVVSWSGFVLILIAAFTFSARTEFPGYAAALPVAGTLLVIGGGIRQTRGDVALLLGVRPVRWLGRISYSLYLWHWPVLIIADERSSHPLNASARVVCVLITLALSAASYYTIERPLRYSQRREREPSRSAWMRSRDAILIGTIAILFAVAISAYTNHRAQLAGAKINERGEAQQSSLTSSAATPQARGEELQHVVQKLVRRGLALHSVPSHVQPPVLRLSTAFVQKYRNCMQGPKEIDIRTCSFGDPTSTRTLLVFGDSHAMQWMPALDTYGSQAGYHVVTLYKAGCPTPSVTVFLPAPLPSTSRFPFPECNAWRAAALDYIGRTKPNLVVTAYSEGQTSTTGQSDPARWLSGLRKTVRAVGRIRHPRRRDRRECRTSAGPRIVSLAPECRSIHMHWHLLAARPCQQRSRGLSQPRCVLHRR